MRVLVALAVMLCCPIVCHAQQVGSTAGYRAMADIQNRALEQEAKFNAAKKLSVMPLPPGLKPSNGSDGLDIDKLTAGMVGKMDYWAFEVLSVVDSKNCLLQLGSERTFWLEDYPTKDLVDGQPVRLIGPVEIRGTKEYTTALGGVRTVRVLRFVPEEQLIKLRKEEEARKAAEEQAKEDALYRTWHSKAGTTVVAKFVEWKLGKIELLTKDGRTIIVPVSAFTDEDAEELRQLNLEHRSKK